MHKITVEKVLKIAWAGVDLGTKLLPDDNREKLFRELMKEYGIKEYDMDRFGFFDRDNYTKEEEFEDLQMEQKLSDKGA